jgi:hypothetical protein
MGARGGRPIEASHSIPPIFFVPPVLMLLHFEGQNLNTEDTERIRKTQRKPPSTFLLTIVVETSIVAS